MTERRSAATVGAMKDAPTAPTLTEAQEEVLVLIGHDQCDCIGLLLRPVVDELVALKLAVGPAPDWVLTQAGRAVFDRLLVD